MKSFNFYILLILSFSWSFGQSCDAKLDEARINYINGNFDDVVRLLSDCAGSLERDQDNLEAFELLINSLQISNQNEEADDLTRALLVYNPLYVAKQTALIPFKRILNSYEIRRKFGITFYAGVNSPQFQIMQYRSYGGIVEESNGYKPKSGLSTGLEFQYYINEKLSLGTGLVIQNSSFFQTETIMEFQQLDVEENITYLKTPLLANLHLSRNNWDLVLSGGISIHHLIRDKANIEMYGLAKEFENPLTGISRKAEGYDLDFQRQKNTLNYMGGITLRRKIGLYSLDFSAKYEHGLNNLVIESERYTNDELIQTYSYVPDDFKMNNLQFVMGVSRFFVYPKKQQL